MKKLESIFEVFVVALFSLAISVLGIGSFVKYQGNIGDILCSCNSFMDCDFYYYG